MLGAGLVRTGFNCECNLPMVISKRELWDARARLASTWLCCECNHYWLLVKGSCGMLRARLLITWDSTCTHMLCEEVEILALFIPRLKSTAGNLHLKSSGVPGARVLSTWDRTCTHLLCEADEALAGPLVCSALASKKPLVKLLW
jgi:hypothetical protein